MVERDGDRDRSTAIVDDWLAGSTVPELRERYSIDLGTLYQVVRDSGRVPMRDERIENGTMADLIIAALRDTILQLATRSAELERENEALKRAAQVRQRAERRRLG